MDAAAEPDSSYPLTLVKVTAVTAVTAGLGGENMAMGHNKQAAKMDGLIGWILKLLTLTSVVGSFVPQFWPIPVWPLDLVLLAESTGTMVNLHLNFVLWISPSTTSLNQVWNLDSFLPVWVTLRDCHVTCFQYYKRDYRRSGDALAEGVFRTMQDLPFWFWDNVEYPRLSFPESESNHDQ